MIRFLNLKNQIIEGKNNFAFYDTFTDEIMNFNGEQIFHGLLNFE